MKGKYTPRRGYIFSEINNSIKAIEAQHIYLELQNNCNYTTKFFRMSEFDYKPSTNICCVDRNFQKQSALRINTNDTKDPIILNKNLNINKDGSGGYFVSSDIF